MVYLGYIQFNLDISFMDVSMDISMILIYPCKNRYIFYWIYPWFYAISMDISGCIQIQLNFGYIQKDISMDIGNFGIYLEIYPRNSLLSCTFLLKSLCTRRFRKMKIFDDASIFCMIPLRISRESQICSKNFTKTPAERPLCEQLEPVIRGIFSRFLYVGISSSPGV